MSNRLETAKVRRRLIVETAIECFVEWGFHQTSIRDIAKRAGISIGNVYNHFENKNALVVEIATYEAGEIEGIQQKLSTIEDPVQALDRFVSLYAKQCCRPGVPLLTAEIVSEGLRNPDIGAEFLKNRSTLAATVASLVEQIVERNDVMLEFSCNDCAEFVIDLIEGLAIRRTFEGKTIKTKDIELLVQGARKLVGL